MSSERVWRYTIHMKMPLGMKVGIVVGLFSFFLLGVEYSIKAVNYVISKPPIEFSDPSAEAHAAAVLSALQHVIGSSSSESTTTE